MDILQTAECVATATTTSITAMEAFNNNRTPENAIRYSSALLEQSAALMELSRIATAMSTMLNIQAGLVSSTATKMMTLNSPTESVQ